VPLFVAGQAFDENDGSTLKIPFRSPRGASMHIELHDENPFNREDHAFVFHMKARSVGSKSAPFLSELKTELYIRAKVPYLALFAHERHIPVQEILDPEDLLRFRCTDA
jgi:hypothetical protein